MRIIIAGGRDFSDQPLMCEKVDFYLSHIREKGVPIIIISGTARGADSEGETYAVSRGIPIERYPAEWDKYGKSAGYRRNEEMAKVADGLIAFWDGKSRGTKHMIDLAHQHNLEVKIVRY